ncbi:membrane protein insertase YidC [Desulfuromonas sp. KJ2020]|uniref:membrane protein insertase YidC n=1 Tax=Desulfuromonas sp. KJ2020 TaxID=2919173 RepID=UPI0020A7A24C|nr:membrane protein insertase YidC [Desulfuromonas sp. KJ2020]MCP3176182.1 membrane protein insertase YidC [Desulfuromonas sp. KJ2020]
MENKNTIIALVLMLVVWVGFTLYSQTQVDQASVQSETVSSNEKQVKTVVSASLEPKMVRDTLPVSDHTLKDIKIREITVETDNYIAVFSNAGANLKSFQLKKYKETAKEGAGFVNLVLNPLQPTLTSAGEGFLFFRKDDLFQANVEEDYIYIKPGDKKELSFQVVNDHGITLVKKYSLEGSGYHFPTQILVYNNSDKTVDGKISLSLVNPFERLNESSSLSFVGPATLVKDDVDTVKKKAIEETVEYGDDIIWTAFEDEYFMSAIVPLDNALESLKIYREGNSILNQVKAPLQTLLPQTSVSFDYFVYMGPRDPGILESVNYRLSEIIDFGIFDFIARPLLFVLNFFYSFVGNYGVAIILLTVVIKIVFWPLTQKSYSSMKAMQTLQPEMQKIREKFKNDKERLNREIMELYKTKRVNPLGGCLPMLIQIPVFFALYKVLLGNIDLRHAPFAFWITDLSAKDPYYITPIIMGGTMFLQQKMTPSTMDPTQAKIFMVMPIVFTFLFLNFPSGLVIYWLVNNVLTILQQYLINKSAVKI